MDGGKIYGKPVDIWAVGFIMYELIAGKHPLWTKGDDNDVYRRKAQEFKCFKFGRKFNKWSSSLLDKLCSPKASMRYTVEQALQHPWITRNFDTDIPRSHFEQNIYMMEIEDKLRNVMNAVFMLSVIQNQPKNAQKGIEKRTVYMKIGKGHSQSPNITTKSSLFIMNERLKFKEQQLLKFKSQSQTNLIPTENKS